MQQPYYVPGGRQEQQQQGGHHHQQQPYVPQVYVPGQGHHQPVVPHQATEVYVPGHHQEYIPEAEAFVPGQEQQEGHQQPYVPQAYVPGQQQQQQGHHSQHYQHHQQQTPYGSQSSASYYGQQQQQPNHYYGQQHHPPPPQQSYYQPQANAGSAFPVYGPYLRFIGVDKIDGGRTTLWNGSVMLLTPVSPHAVSEFPKPPVLHLSSENGGQQQSIPGVLLYSAWGYDCYRFVITVPVRSHPQRFFYTFNNCHNNGAPPPSYDFHVASLADRYWRVAFTSCSGFSDASPETIEKMGGVTPLFNDILRKHGRNPYHVLVGGGDQIYCDDVWKLEPLKEWLKLPGKDSRLRGEWTPRMDHEVDRFYFQSYCHHFASAGMRDVYARIPQMNTCDDHDVFDGFGSYPDFLERSNVFRNLRRIGYKYFLLFQHQTTPETPRRGLFMDNTTSYSMLNQLGESLAVLIVDTRFQRCRQQIVPQQEWDTTFHNVQTQLPATTKHLVVVFGVPIVYPRLDTVENALGGVASAKHFTGHAFKQGTKYLGKGIGKIAGKKYEDAVLAGGQKIRGGFGKTGLMKGVLNHFGLVSLEDDLIDHWTNKHHDRERDFVISSFQNVSRLQRLRVTFLAGDVHVAAVGRLYNPKDPTDHRCMYQVVSSAVSNAPPPAVVLRTIHHSCQNENTPPKRYGSDNVAVREEMIDLFRMDVHGRGPPGPGMKLLGRRNWCSIDAAGENQHKRDGLVFTIMAENDGKHHHSHENTVPYRVTVPPVM